MTRRLKALAVSGKSRTPLMAEVPTFSEAGFAHVDPNFFYGLVAAAGTPDDVVKKISADIRTVVPLQGLLAAEKLTGFMGEE